MCEDGQLERTNPHSLFSAKEVHIIMLYFAFQILCAEIMDEKYAKLNNVSTGFLDKKNSICDQMNKFISTWSLLAIVYTKYYLS